MTHSPASSSGPLPAPSISFSDAADQARFERFVAAGQGHVFGLWPTLSEEERDPFRAQLDRIDLDRVAEFQRLLEETRAASGSDDPSTQGGGPRSGNTGFEAPPVVEPATTEVDRLNEARLRGEALLRDGGVAALTVAGGQASRLGLDLPKGCLPFGPVTERTLFELFARQIAAGRTRYAAEIPWLVMTSPANHDQTRAFFEQHEWFGLGESTVRLFPQGMVPALDEEGRLCLAAPGRLFENPDGHGGVFGALHKHGLLDWLRERGVTQLSYFQVDNPQARILDPLFLGLHVQDGGVYSSKVVSKEEPDEKVGLLVRHLDGTIGLVEYSDLSAAVMNERDESGRLRLRAGNPAIHALAVEFVDAIAGEERLPFHIAHKKVPHLDPAAAVRGEAQLIEPDAPNAYKFERFVFDALPEAGARVALLEIERDAEFLPIKSASGPTSPEAVAASYQRFWAQVLTGFGVTLTVDEAGVPTHPLEVDPIHLLDPPSNPTLRQLLIDRKVRAIEAPTLL